MKTLRMIASGVAGAAALTAAHQVVKETVPDAPRMDVLGMRGIEQLCEKMGWKTPNSKVLFGSALVGDLVSNAIYYSPVGSSKGGSALGKGLSLGLMAGLGAVKVPELIGLGKDASAKNPRQMLMTVGLYVLGGLAAAAAATLIPSRE